MVIFMLDPKSSSIISGILPIGLPVANVKLVPKKKPEAAALFKPYLSTPFTAVRYLSQAAFSLAKDRTCAKSH